MIQLIDKLYEDDQISDQAHNDLIKAANRHYAMSKEGLSKSLLGLISNHQKLQEFSHVLNEWIYSLPIDEKRENELLGLIDFKWPLKLGYIVVTKNFRIEVERILPPDAKGYHACFINGEWNVLHNEELQLLPKEIEIYLVDWNTEPDADKDLEGFVYKTREEAEHMIQSNESTTKPVLYKGILKPVDLKGCLCAEPDIHDYGGLGKTPHGYCCWNCNLKIPFEEGQYHIKQENIEPKRYFNS